MRSVRPAKGAAHEHRVQRRSWQCWQREPLDDPPEPSIAPDRIEERLNRDAPGVGRSLLDHPIERVERRVEFAGARVGDGEQVGVDERGAIDLPERIDLGSRLGGSAGSGQSCGNGGAHRAAGAGRLRNRVRDRSGRSRHAHPRGGSIQYVEGCL